MKGNMKEEGKPAFCCNSFVLFVLQILAAGQNLGHFLVLNLYSAPLTAIQNLLPSSDPSVCKIYLEERVGSKMLWERRKNKKWFQKALCLKEKFKKGRQIKR